MDFKDIKILLCDDSMFARKKLNMSIAAMGVGKIFEAADGADAKITSVGSPRYRIVVNAAEYKTAEDILKRVSATAIKSLEDDGGVAVLKRESK